MSIPAFQLVERGGSVLRNERVLRATWAPDGQVQTALIRNTAGVGPVPVAGGQINVIDRTHASDRPSPRVVNALSTLRIAAEQADVGSILVEHGTPTFVKWAVDEHTFPMQVAAEPDVPIAVRDALSAARGARSSITGGPLRPMDPNFT